MDIQSGSQRQDDYQFGIRSAMVRKTIAGRTAEIYCCSKEKKRRTRSARSSRPFTMINDECLNSM